MQAEGDGEGPLAGLGGIVLAAGGATRYGGPKQLAQIDGATLVVRAARLALEFCPAGVVVVTGACAREVGASLSGCGVDIAYNRDWAEGMAGSLRCGLGALPERAHACLVMLCDQVAVDAQDIRRLVQAWALVPQHVAAARYAETLGVPAIFPASFWPGLAELTGDQGARALVARLTALVTPVDLPNAAVDVDTPADLAGN